MHFPFQKCFKFFTYANIRIQVFNLLALWTFYTLVSKALIIIDQRSLSKNIKQRLETVLNESLLNNEPRAIENLANETRNASYDKYDKYDKCRIPDLKYDGLHEKKQMEKECKIKRNWGHFDAVSKRWSLYEDIKQKYARIECKYRSILRSSNDFNKSLGQFKELVEGREAASDVVEVECADRSGAKFHSLFPIIRNKLDKNATQLASELHDSHVEQENTQCTPLNIVLISFDSVSRVSWTKRLPKSVAYALDTMKFDILDGYNIVGDGTPAALIPILTGRTEEELPSVLKSDPNGRFVDEAYPFIWKDLHKKGYMSFYMDDWPHLSPFTYRLRGFSNQTTKHYFRQYQLRLWEMVGKNYASKKAHLDDFCIGALKRHKVALDLVQQFKREYEPKSKNIAIMHYVENSHDTSERLNWLDDDLYAFLHENNNEANAFLFNRTAVFLYSDHGSRFTDKRNAQRYLEERLPFFSVYLPAWYKSKYKAEYENFVRNKRKLTSPFDIYATLRHLTCLDDSSSSSSNIEYDKQARGISLLREIDEKRTCEHIGISEHYCTCERPWMKLRESERIVKQCVDFAIEAINNLTHNFRAKCLTLELKSILSAEKLEHKNSPRLNFKIEFTTRPNDAIYEAYIYANEEDSTSFEFRRGELAIRTRNDISRIDAYGDQPYCVADFAQNPSNMLDLRKFCYCKPKNNKKRTQD